MLDSSIRLEHQDFFISVTGYMLWDPGPNFTNGWLGTEETLIGLCPTTTYLGYVTDTIGTNMCKYI